MSIKNKLMVWAIKNIFQPGLEIIDKPGFVITKFTEKHEQIYLRELIWPESFFVELENAIVGKYGEAGKNALYSVGKKFGYGYAQMSLFDRSGSVSNAKLEKFIHFFLRYVEAMWGPMNETIDLDNKVWDVKMNDFIVCKKSGIGLILTLGAPTGMWSYILDDKTIEGSKSLCEGRGDSTCQIYCAPKEYLSTSELKYFKVEDMPNLSMTSEYRNLNKIRPSEYCKNSLKSLIDFKFFSYKNKVLSRNNERYFWCESHLAYHLENELKKLDGGSDILFNSAFEFGKNIGKTEGKTNWAETFTNYLSGLGWGDGIAFKKSNGYNVIVNYFPWSIYSKNSEFTLFKGLCSGLLSGLLGEDIFLKKHQQDTSNGYLRLNLSSLKD